MAKATAPKRRTPRSKQHKTIVAANPLFSDLPLPPGYNSWHEVTLEWGGNPGTQKPLQVSAVYACAKVLGEDIGKLPLLVNRRLTPRGKERSPEHELYSLLSLRPNPWMTAMKFKETLTQWCALHGRGCAEIERRGDGVPLALWPIHPGKIQPLIDHRENL